MKTIRTALALALLAALPAAAQARVGTIWGNVQATDGVRLIDATGAWVTLCDGPGTQCREVARQQLRQSDTGEGINGYFEFTGRSCALKVHVWRDDNGNGVVDDGDLEGWYREGIGDPVPVEPGVHSADITMVRVGSERWREENESGMGRISGAIAIPGHDAVNQTPIVACVAVAGACDPDRTYHGWVEDFDGRRGRYVIEVPMGATYTVFAWLDADGDGTPGIGERAALAAGAIGATASGVDLDMQAGGGKRLPALAASPGE